MENQILSTSMINQFADYLRAEERAKNTIAKYIRDVTGFAVYAGGIGISKELALAYKQSLLSKGYAPSSINSIVAALNCLFMFIGKPDCRLKALKVQRQAFCSEERELTKAEYARLVRTAREMGKERLHLVLQTICATGIRVSELEFITVEAVKSGKATVSMKGKTRTVFIIKELKKKLLRYIAQHKIIQGSVFITRTGKPLSRTNIWREMKQLCESAGVHASKVFPHNLRHLFARCFYSMKKDIARLADILGHSSINTTRIYMVTTGEEHRRCMEQLRLII